MPLYDIRSSVFITADAYAATIFIYSAIYHADHTLTRHALRRHMPPAPPYAMPAEGGRVGSEDTLIFALPCHYDTVMPACFEILAVQLLHDITPDCLLIIFRHAAVLLLAPCLLLAR